MEFEDGPDPRDRQERYLGTLRHWGGLRFLRSSMYTTITTWHTKPTRERQAHANRCMRDVQDATSFVQLLCNLAIKPANRLQRYPLDESAIDQSHDVRGNVVLNALAWLSEPSCDRSRQRVERLHDLIYVVVVRVPIASVSGGFLRRGAVEHTIL